MIGLSLAVLGIFAIILVGSLQIDDIIMRRFFVGFLSCASLISMFASPLFIIVSVLFPSYPSIMWLWALPFRGEFTYITHYIFSEIGHSDKECWIHAVLSLTFHLPNEHLFLTLWIIQRWCLYLCKLPSKSFLYVFILEIPMLVWHVHLLAYIWSISLTSLLDL